MSALSQTRVTILGLGVMGNIYLRRLRANGWRHITTVDPRPEALADFTSLAAAQDSGRATDLWVIATPTYTHIQLVKDVLARCPDARIIVEKPVGDIDDMRALVDTLVHQYPKARVRVSDLYGRGAFADVLRQGVSELPGRLVDVAIEMSKNRIADELANRFVCRDYGEYGYEWFHVLRLLNAVLPAASSRSLISGQATYEVFHDSVWHWEVDGIKVVAASNIDGRVSMPELGRKGQPGWLTGAERFRRLRVRTDQAALVATFDDARSAFIQIRPFLAGSAPDQAVQSSDIAIERSDAVVDSIISFLQEDTVPHPWESLEIASHAALARLARNSGAYRAPERNAVAV